jgi:phospholipid/cholesterol/gamma-HCH transport system ATP-binding protein
MTPQSRPFRPPSNPALPPAAGGEVVIRIRGLGKSFGKLAVLDEFNLDVRRGETFTVVGPSGSGKSTLLKLIIGLLRPDRGAIVVDDADLAQAGREDIERARQSIGMVFQYAALLASLTVEENVALPLIETRGMTMEQARPIVAEKLALVGLSKFAEYMPFQLSGGMRKRAGFARAIVHNPKIVLYDEPTTGLDPVICRQINDLIIDLREKLGVTGVVISHDIEGAYRVSDRMGVMFRGKLVEEGTPEDMKESTNPAVRQLLDGLPDGPLTDSEWRPA